MSVEHEQDSGLHDDLLKVCSLLNKQGVRYLVAGAHACILHGLVRTTEDVDLLVQKSDTNLLNTIKALSELSDHAAAELTVADFHENVIVKIVDEVEVDVSTQAWKVSYDEAENNAQSLVLNGVMVPYLGLKDLIRSKETYREKDRVDLAHLKQIADRNHG